jgi:antitoxin component YwqK of YwqJK toxin-antitoxin module|tara:strand:- start:604 stop:1146 length:543 start_codon:yes stop_codon:yes gene_type:complete
MNKNVGVATAIGVAIIIGVIAFQIYESTYQRSSVEEYYADTTHGDEKNIKHVVHPPNPQTLRGLTINKDMYLLGENVFMSITNIPMGLKDSVQVYAPNGKGYLSLDFDGNEKSSMKHYFKPGLLKSLDLCDKEKLVGEWTIIFAGLPNEKLHFNVTEEILPGQEEYYITCSTETIQFQIP